MFEPYVNSLIAVSSFRALDDSAEVAANQLRAKRSWDLVFDRIFLFGAHDKRMASPTTEFLPSDDFTHISTMAWVASQQTIPTCILNADIVVAPNLKALVNQAWAKGALAMTSQRLEFDPKTEDYFRARVVDYGCDFFCAKPEVWRQVHKTIPVVYRIGNGLWDSWMLNFLILTFPKRFLDITTLGPIFHPKHGDRKRATMGEIPHDRFLANGMGFPPPI